MTIIDAQHIGKKYKINKEHKNYGTLRDSLGQIFSNPLKLFTGFKKEEFWALQNINFSVNQGEAIGIIGANGAGKSTLLKIMARITTPTTGQIIIRGKVSALLEVGTGFHQELTGRENIYLNGAIMGMKRKEINKKMDKIIEFSGIEKFIDTPVKHYSSGMSVRLGFSVAAHLEPDVLIIDEVLAVGDAGFQQQSIQKMREIINNEGRTIVFVSHNMEAVKTVCQRCILINKGEVVASGATSDIIAQYYKLNG